MVTEGLGYSDGGGGRSLGGSLVMYSGISISGQEPSGAWSLFIIGELRTEGATDLGRIPLNSEGTQPAPEAQNPLVSSRLSPRVLVLSLPYNWVTEGQCN